jgi:hypothetical protein
MPTNIAPKQDGHDIAVSAERQYSQRVASGPGAAAPQLGQFNEESMALKECVVMRATRQALTV